MEKERWLKEQNLNLSGEGDGGERMRENENESKFFALAARTLQRMTSKDEKEEGDKEDKGNVENKKEHDQFHSPIPLVGHHDLVDQDDRVGEEGEKHDPDGK